MSIIEKLDKYLNENQNIVSKAIYEMQGLRYGKLQLMAEYENGETKALSWNEYKKLNVKDKSSDKHKKDFIESLLFHMKDEKAKDKFDKIRKKLSFEDKVDWLLKNGATYKPKGIKHWDNY